MDDEYKMNIQDIIKSINDFRGRKFLIVLVIWYLVYIGKVNEYYGGVSTVTYFILDLLEKYLVHKSEDDNGAAK
jgi:hypothetical protein